MGVLGTGVAAGVAQVSMQAQQLGRQQGRQAIDRAYVLQRQKEVRETRLKGLEEDDGAEAETALHVDGELPDPDRHPDASPQRGHDHHHLQSEADSSGADEASDEAGEDALGEPVTYTSPLQPQHHTPPVSKHRLDVKA